MSSLSRFQYSAIVRAAILAVTPLYPAMQIGQNVPPDLNYATLRVYNDRTFTSGFYTDVTGATPLPTGSQDATTGLPTTAFAVRLAQGALATDASVTGNWCLNYEAPVARTATVTSGSGITLVSSTYSGGVGRVTVGYTAGASALHIGLDGGVTALSCYDPTTYSIWGSGGTPPLASAQWVATTVPWSYLRMMDCALINQDFVQSNSWPDVINWSDRRTPANFYKDNGQGAKGGMPLEFQVGLLNAANKPGWLNISELATDDYITQYATYVANNLAVGLHAVFELSNERWNTGGGFWNYRKAGFAGQTECVAFQAAATTEWIRTYMGGCHVSTFSSDGTTATVVFAGGSGHGQTIGTSTLVPKIQTTQGAYTNFGATGAMTVVDAFTITYPTNQVNTSGSVAATTVLGSSDFLALNGAAGLFTGNFISSIFKFSNYWHYRRAMQMAKLVKDAFTAAGRAVADCQPVLCLQAGAGDSGQYAFGAKSIINFISAQFSGAKLSDRFKAIAIGGYLQLDQGVAVAGFGLTSNRLTPTDSTSVLAQLKQMADVGYGTYNYGCTASWVSANGMELWGYEIGLDTIGGGGQSTTTQNACTAANADPAMQAIITEWVQNFVALGFKRIGWYQCGAGSYATFGCFNLGQTAAEVMSTTAPSGQSPKFKGVMGAITPWSTPQPRHVFPCTLSGYDCVGNEAVVTVGTSWPSLSGVNLPTFGYYNGPSGNGQTYFVWLEAALSRTATVTVSGDYTTSGAITVSAQPLNGAGSGGGSFGLSGVHSASTLGSCTVTLQPGPNFVFISASSNAANVFPHSVQFS
jgi:hypothetical protein